MAEAALQLDRRAFSCSICLDFLKDPATLPCGHNYCRSCIQSHWDREAQGSCPLCRTRFSSRPALVTNTMLAELVEQLKRSERNASFQKPQMQREFNRDQILHIIQDKEKELQHLQQEVLSFRHCADEAVKHSEKSFSSLVQVLEFAHNEVSREIRALQEREEAKLKQLHDKLQQDITELKMTVSHQDSLTPGQAVIYFPPPSALDPPRTYSLPLGFLEQAASAVTALTDLLQVTLRDGLQNISQSFRSDPHPPPRPQAALTLPEPKTREEFLNYAREIILDPNTAHKYLSMSRGNRRATKSTYFLSSDDHHPDRFSDYYQALSTEPLTGRCYWEVEWEGLSVVIAVSYRSIGRKGDSEDCGFGYNDKSWALDCKTREFSFWHHSLETKVSRSVSKRIGVYMDHSAGVLTFYNIDENQTMSLLHRVQTTFTHPLYAGIRLECTDTAYFPKLR